MNEKKTVYRVKFPYLTYSEIYFECDNMSEAFDFVDMVLDHIKSEDNKDASDFEVRIVKETIEE